MEENQKLLKNNIRPAWRTGTDSPFWKDNNLGYWGIHQWLIKYYGKANKCENKDCSGKCKKYQWANIKNHNHKRCRQDYMMLCISCHRKMDYENVRGNCCPKGHLLDEKNTYIPKDGRRRCKECRRVIGRKHDSKRRWYEKIYGVRTSSFSRLPKEAIEKVEQWGI